MIRAFLGIGLPRGHRDALERLQDSLPVGRPAPPENFHLTLAFLGEQSEDRLQELHLALEALREPVAEVEVAGLGTFGRRAPAVAIAEIRKTPALDRLHGKIRNLVRAAGIGLGRERFRPHVTLARFDRRLAPQDLDRLRLWLERHAGFALPAYPAREVTLYRSTLTRAGALHDPLAGYPLGGG